MVSYLQLSYASLSEIFGVMIALMLTKEMLTKVALLAVAGYIIHQCVIFASCIDIPPLFPKMRKLSLALGISLIAGGSLSVAIISHYWGSVLLILGLAFYFLSDSRQCKVVKNVRQQH